VIPGKGVPTPKAAGFQCAVLKVLLSCTVAVVLYASLKHWHALSSSLALGVQASVLIYGSICSLALNMYSNQLFCNFLSGVPAVKLASRFPVVIFTSAAGYPHSCAVYLTLLPSPLFLCH